MARIDGQDVQLLAVQNLDVNGNNIGPGYTLLADYESCKLELEKADIDSTATKDTAETGRVTHTRGTISITGMVQAYSNSAKVIATSSYGVVEFQSSTNGDAWVVPVLISKFTLDVPGKEMDKETLDFKINGVCTVNGIEVVP